MELLPNDVIESILERIDVKTLLKFKSVSKQWRSTIQSSYFQQRQLIQQRRQSRGDPYVLLVSVHDRSSSTACLEAMRMLSLGSPSISLRIPTPWEDEFYDVCKTSCDGLVYLYDIYERPSIVVNPTTRWHRTVPLCNYQLLAREKAKRDETFDVPYVFPGFGKDKINGTYKSVWLYNSAEMGINDNPTTCEVFDFATNSWRYVVPASPYLLLYFQEPVYFNGSLHSFTASSPQGETMVLSFDLHTETFDIICKAPFLHATEKKINICNLDGRLCVSQEKGFNQIIWSFDSVHKTWNQIYSIDLTVTIPLIRERSFGCAHLPLGVLGKDNVLLFYDPETGNPLITLDPNTKSYHVPHTSKFSSLSVCYFPSLISIL